MDYEEIKKLIDDMGNAKIDELEIEFPEGIKISMKKNAEKKIILKNISDMKQQNFIPETTNMQLDNQSIINSDVKANINIDSIQEEKYKIIKSPMVGTFYSKPPPNKAFLFLFSSNDSIAIAPVCANDSTINTPGIIGLPGKYPLK